MTEVEIAMMNMKYLIYKYGMFAAHDSATRSLEFSPTKEFPALQYLDRVEKGSAADKAGLKPGDFLIEVCF